MTLSQFALVDPSAFEVRNQIYGETIADEGFEGGVDVGLVLGPISFQKDEPGQIHAPTEKWHIFDGVFGKVPAITDHLTTSRDRMNQAKVEEATMIADHQSRFRFRDRFHSSDLNFDTVLILKHVLTDEPQRPGYVAIDCVHQGTREED